MTIAIDWDNLGFEYHKLPFRYISYYKNGQWDKGQLTEDATLHISESAPALHYGQQAFEGLKAYRTKDGSIQLFRPDRNAVRLQATADRLLMPQVSTEQFIDAAKQVVKANEDFVPPYGTGAAKVGGNYAGSLLPGKAAKSAGFSDVIYLDPATHTKIEEVGAANFFGITANNEFVTPLSPSILPSITKYSLLQLAEERLGMTVIEGDVPINELDKFVEAGACGTAAVISPIGGIQYKDNLHVFYSETEVGPVTRRLYDELVGIQFGDIEAPEGWIVKVD
ncbi:TPA: branched-chain-amino-acid transaminase [Streptococcus pyogenes]|nr:branched-chain-amino-acid transaminase [Streptococcus pyogenes]